MERDKLKSIIESLLFASAHPISILKLAKITEAKKEEIEQSVIDLTQHYQKKQSGLAIVKKDDMVQLVTNSENSEFIEKMMKTEIEGSLSQVALEVLSVVTYKGPLSKSEIEAIRGVNCSYTLRNLMIRGLIERKSNPNDSRGYLYEISFEFLRKMGVGEVKNMPKYDKLSIDDRADSIISNE